MGIMDAMSAAGASMGGRMGRKPFVGGPSQGKRRGRAGVPLQQERMRQGGTAQGGRMGIGPSMGRLGGMMGGGGGMRKPDPRAWGPRMDMGGGMNDRRRQDMMQLQQRMQGGVPRGVPGGEMNPGMMGNRMMDLMQQLRQRPQIQRQPDPRQMGPNPQQMLMAQRQQMGRMY